ncbi:LysE family translocator [Undibacterium sp.]|uniref:LysE family translocator n=1 Tax=Undibacterium sp. TaxID=1914977 RepID=UPI0025E03A06|nr:LysE family translocator [Undibacterium sp.]
MFGTQDLALFVISGLLLNLAPGPDSLLIMTRAASQGWRAGSAAALGIGSGTFVHILAAALGLSAVLATSAAAFLIVKLIGAAYLLYVGLGLLLSKKKSSEDGEQTTIVTTRLSYRKIFLQGFLTNLLNPKVAVFFLAFVPQFIASSAPDKALAFIFLGCIFNFNGMLWCHFLAFSSAYASQKLRVNRRLSAGLNRLIGLMFVSFGLKLALANRN